MQHLCHFFNNRSHHFTWTTPFGIKINQNRNIRQNDIVVLADISDFNALPDGTTIYDITRFYHGQDDDRPDLITDINLEVMEP